MHFPIKNANEREVESKLLQPSFLRAPAKLSRKNLFLVQQIAGNMAFQRLLGGDVLQAKMIVSNTDDPLEREANQVADAVMTTREPQLSRQSKEKNEDLMRSTQVSNATDVNNEVHASIDAKRGSGQPLMPAERSFFENRFSFDFNKVRIHSDAGASELTNLMRARAFTTGHHIFLAGGEAARSSENHRRLLAHELTHVVQQGHVVPRSIHSRKSFSANSRSNTNSILQRLPDETSPDAPEPQTIERVSRGSWRVRVDAAIRALFGLTGLGMTAGRVHFLEPAAFAVRFPASEIENLLLDMFLSPPMGSHFRDILRHHQMSLAASGPTAISALRRFITERMRIGYFEYTHLAPPVPTRRSTHGGVVPAAPEVRTPVQITPGELVAEAVAGVTTTAGPRASRRVSVEMPARVETLVHEGCHYYVHSAFRQLANSTRYQDRLFRGIRISSMLMEGFAEYFARQVMWANATDFGPLAIQAYDEEVDLVNRLVITLGEAQARQAYFHGNAAALSQLERALGLNIQAYPLLVPDFMISTPVQTDGP